MYNIVIVGLIFIILYYDFVMSQISVIIPVYNAEKTIIKCLNSIQEQTFKDFEALLINDGSKDGSAEICEDFCAKDNRFKLITQENAGPSKARNRGIDESGSKYLAFVDSDDYIEPNMLEELYAAAEKANADVTICGYYTESNNRINSVYSSKYKPGVYCGEGYRKIVVDAIDIGVSGNIPPYSCVRLVRRECLENPRLRFDTQIYRSEDYLLWNQVFLNNNSLCLITDKPLYHYVVNDDSITHRYVKDYWNMSMKVYTELENLAHEDKTIGERLNIMLMRRAYLAMSISAFARDRKTFCKDLKKVLKDKELSKVIDSIPLSVGIKKGKIRYILLKFRMHFIIKMIFSYKYFKAH